MPHLQKIVRRSIRLVWTISSMALAVASAQTTAVTLRAGDIAVSDQLGSTVYRIDRLTGARTVISSGGLLAHPIGLALEANGQIVVGDSANDIVIRIDPTTSTQTLLSSGGV